MVFFKQHDVELFDLLGSLSFAVFQLVVKRLERQVGTFLILIVIGPI